MKVFSNLRNLQILSVVLSAIGLADSLYLWWTKISQTSIICGVGDCDLVNASPYSSLLGVPVAAIGAAGYGALLVAALWALIARDDAPPWLTNARLVLASGGLFFAAYLTGIEAFILHAYCIWCVLQAAAMLGIFVGLWMERRVENA
ncbi:MAG: vitamin K epoxide reductase family protein [Chloroflexota bacterium]